MIKSKTGPIKNMPTTLPEIPRCTYCGKSFVKRFGLEGAARLILNTVDALRFMFSTGPRCAARDFIISITSWDQRRIGRQSRAERLEEEYILERKIEKVSRVTDDRIAAVAWKHTQDGPLCHECREDEPSFMSEDEKVI